ncbi:MULTISPECIES: aldo/keto reductase [unclassified Virgibacillus]|uniref:aldo/keto reductase n=1 Tax=unclassified Virgibacillus TaxID=2620237 RepID=UPI0024DE5A6C|nr:aldo/keto reductase [Virgibacillus sp. LDC-1]
MFYKELGNTAMKISALSFGTWAIGGAWGKTNDHDALEGLARAIDLGVNFFDTADVYGDGHSEELLAKATKGKEGEIYIASKFCRAGDIHDPTNYSEEVVTNYCEQSLKRLQREYIDLYQIHCPPMDILRAGHVFDTLEKLKTQGKIRYYGVSVETVEEGLYVLEHTNASSLQVIFNLFRQKPLKKLFPLALEKEVGILSRVPLASGLLTGKFTEQTSFASDDHRYFNKDGAAFNVGETFAGIEFARGVELSRKLEWIAEGRDNMTRAALKWIVEQEAVTSVIPGFRNKHQVEDNVGALAVKAYQDDELEKLRRFYELEVKPYIRGAY